MQNYVEYPKIVDKIIFDYFYPACLIYFDHLSEISILTSFEKWKSFKAERYGLISTNKKKNNV